MEGGHLSSLSGARERCFWRENFIVSRERLLGGWVRRGAQQHHGRWQAALYFIDNQTIQKGIKIGALEPDPPSLPASVLTLPTSNSWPSHLTLLTSVTSSAK